MKNRSTYVLLILFFAALVGLWWADSSKIPTQAERLRNSSRVLPELIDAKPDDLQKIEILGGKVPMVFVRQQKELGNGWQMIAPMNVEADPSKVETLAFNLKELSRKPEAATLEGDASQFGLAPPEMVIRLWGTDSSEPLASLDIGHESDALGRRYVRRTGSPGIEVVDARGLALLKILPNRWRDHELFRVPSFEVDGVTLKSRTDELNLKRGRDAWRLEKPKVLAAGAKVEGLIADLGSLRVSSDSQFVANDVRTLDLDRYGLLNPNLTIEVSAGRSSSRRPPQTLLVGKPVEGNPSQVYVRRAGQDDVLAVEARVLKDIKIDPNLYRSSKVVDLKTARATKIAVEQKMGGFELEKKGNEWTITKPETLKTDRKAVDEFLKAIDKVETSMFLEPTKAPGSGLESPTSILKIWQKPDARETLETADKGATPDPDGTLALALEIGRRDAVKKVIYARIQGDRTVLALPDSASDFLPRSNLAFRDRVILREEIDPIQQITVVVEGRKVVLNAPALKINLLRNAPMGWWMIDPVDAPADAPSIGLLLRLLSNFRADGLVSEDSRDLEQYGLKTPMMSLTWSSLPSFSVVAPTPAPIPARPDGVVRLEERSFLLGSPVPGQPTQRFAKISDRPLIFTVGPEIISVLSSEWRDHHVMSFKPARVKKIRFDWPARGFTLEPSSESNPPGWSIQGGNHTPDFPLKDVAKMVQYASNMTTTRFAQHVGDFPPLAHLNPARLSLRFELDDGTIPRVLRIGATDGRGNVYATTDPGTSGAVFLIPEAFVKPWIDPPAFGDLPANVFGP